MIKILFKFLLLYPVFIYSDVNYILMGPPGSGKGTFCAYMKDKKGYDQISIGDIVRYHKKNDTEFGRQIRANNGFVTDEIAFAIIENAIMEKIKKGSPFILDGFPRNKKAFDFLLETMQRKNLLSAITFVHFDVDDATCLNRINHRLVCPSCAMSFSIAHNITECPKCQKLLESRPGDDQETTLMRLKSYHEETEPLIKDISEKFKLMKIKKDSSYENLFR